MINRRTIIIRPRMPRRGFATFMAILLLAMVGATLTAVGMMFATEARRTRSHATETQLRQLLTAGAIDALKQLDHDGDAATTQATVTLPDELSAGGGKLSVRLEREGERRRATIRAEIGRRSMEQVVRFERREGKWTPIAASLTPSTAPTTAPLQSAP